MQEVRCSRWLLLVVILGYQCGLLGLRKAAPNAPRAQQINNNTRVVISKGSTSLLTSKRHDPTICEEAASISNTLSMFQNPLTKKGSPSYVAKSVLREYIQMHSVQQLKCECPQLLDIARQEGNANTPYSLALPGASVMKNSSISMIDIQNECPALANRRFMIGFYSCPVSAGNRVKEFMVSLAWAIATNRTLLYKYHDMDTSLFLHISKVGKPKFCERYLHLNRWVPSFDDWKWAIDWSTIPNAIDGRKYYAYSMVDQTRQRGIDVIEMDLMNVGTWVKRNAFDEHLANTKLGNTFHTERALEATGNLVSAGTEYMYGMLFDSLFSFNEATLPPPLTVLQKRAAEVGTTVAIHSRHWWSGQDDGSNVTSEMQCLDELLAETRSQYNATSSQRQRTYEEPCLVYIMSDRSNTINAISELVRDRHNCTAQVLEHTPNRTNGDGNKEHGPFANAFFRDMIFVGRARDVLLGTDCTSTDLVEEYLVYRREEDGIGLVHDANRPYRKCQYDVPCQWTKEIC